MNYLIVAHKYLPQPDDELVSYLNEKEVENVAHITHAFSDANSRSSSLKHYMDGDIKRERSTCSFNFLRFFEPLIYLKELVFTFFWALIMAKRWDIYIGMDGLCVFFGLVLKWVGFVDKVVFWAIDFVPEDRFDSSIKNKFYQSINTFSYKKADVVWDLSPRMGEARERHLDLAYSDYKSHRVVPYGMWIDRIDPISYENAEKNTLVFMGHLLPKQGVQLVLDAVPKIKEKVPDFKFKVIGAGSYLATLKKKAKKLGVGDSVEFVGRIEDNKEMEKEIAESTVAIAPYIEGLDTWTYYADPGKVKTYLACGVPVLLTGLPWNAKEIEEFGAGKVIEENADSVVHNVINFLDRKINSLARKRAREYAQRYNYESIFKEILQ